MVERCRGLQELDVSTAVEGAAFACGVVRNRFFLSSGLALDLVGVGTTANHVRFERFRTFLTEIAEVVVPVGRVLNGNGGVGLNRVRVSAYLSLRLVLVGASGRLKATFSCATVLSRLSL